MAGRVWTVSRPAATVAFVISVVSLPAPGPVTASEASHALPGRTMVALTADVDGDGTHELVRLVRDASTTIGVEVWAERDGRWTMSGPAAIPPDDRSGESVDAGSRPATLLATAVNGETRVLVLVGEIDPAAASGGCCLAGYELTIVDGRLVLTALEMDDSGPVDTVMAVDLDADGTDEVLVAGTTWVTGGAVENAVGQVRVLARDGIALTALRSWEEGGYVSPLVLADSDGLAGDEALVGFGEDGLVHRVSRADGEVVVEATILPAGPSRVSGVVGGTLVVDVATGVQAVDWRAGGTPLVVDQLSTDQWPYTTVLGTGPEAIVLLHEWHDELPLPSIRVLDAALREIGSIGDSARETTIMEFAELIARNPNPLVSRSVWPTSGPVPGGWTDGRAAYVAAGALVQPGGPGGYEVRELPMLLSTVVGTLGAGARWVAVGDVAAAGRTSYLTSEAGDPGLLVIVRSDELTAEATGWSVMVEGAVEIGSEDASGALLASPDGFELSVSAPAGAAVVQANRSRILEHRATNGEVRIEVRPPRDSDDESVTFDEWLLFITPDGRASVSRWRGSFAPAAPELSAVAEPASLALDADVSGAASHDSTIVVDGREVALDRAGTFALRIDATPWPRDVVVVARDPFGGETVRVVEAVGFVDLRGLPWVPIIGLLTVAAGALLFVRTPSRRREMGDRPIEAGATLEELEGD